MDLIERLRSVKWEVIDDDDWDSRCVFVDMRPDDFEALLNEAAAAIEADRHDRGASMTTEIELLPMPKGEAVGMYQAWSCDQMRDYARANVAHATATLQAEIEALRAEVDALREVLSKILENEASNWKAAEEFGGYVLDDELREEARTVLAKENSND